MDDKKMNSIELSDEELKVVQGGFSYWKNNDGGYYKYTGSNPDQKYLCPKCGRPVHEGTGWRFYCDPCDESWFFEDKLTPNLNSGAWTSISKEEYDTISGASL